MNFDLQIAKKAEEGEPSYGHDATSVEKYEKYAKNVEAFFKGKVLNKKYAGINGVKVSNTGCNIWLVVYHHGRWNDHIIHTTQNEHLAKFGFGGRNTDLERFIE
jgi:hypothetical protein